MFWYWSLLALLLAVVIVSVVGVLTRYYFGKRMIAWADNVMLRVPVLNKIYGTIKQVDEAFTSGKKSSFKTVVLVEYPREGIYSVGFITSEQDESKWSRKPEKMRLRFHPDHADPDGRIFDHRAGGKSHQARHVRRGRLQIHHQPRRAFLRAIAATENQMIESATGIVLRTRPLTETSLDRPLAHAKFRAHRDGCKGRATPQIAVSRQAGFVLSRRIFRSAAAAVRICTLCAKSVCAKRTARCGKTF